MSETENARKKLNQGILINVGYIIFFTVIAIVVKKQWPEGWYYWIPIVLAIGCVLTIGSLLFNKRMINRLNNIGDEIKRELKDQDDD